MVKKGKLLLPWYKYPPFSNESIGGLSVAVWEVTRELGKHGVHVDVLTPESTAEVRGKAQGVMVIASELGRKFCKNQTLVKEEKQALEDYDAILSVANYGAQTLHSYRRGISRVSRQIHAGPNRPLSTYVSLTPNKSEYLKMILAKLKDQRNLRLLKGTKTLCVSEYVRGKMQSGLEDHDNLLMIPNGIQTRSFRPMDEVKQYDLLFIGRFQKSKGLDILLKALSFVASVKGDIYKLAIVGPFSAGQREYIFQVVPPAVKRALAFLGPINRDALPAVINQSRMVVVPSRYESFGLPALEAIACGTPVLAARVGGLPEIIDESVGVLVEPDNPHALAKAIHDFFRLPNLAETVATAGPAKAKRYDWEEVAPQLQRAFFA